LSILRTQLQNRGMVTHHQNESGAIISATTGIFDVIAESEADLTAEQTALFAPGSMAYCLHEDSLRIKNSAGLWEEVL